MGFSSRIRVYLWLKILVKRSRFLSSTATFNIAYGEISECECNPMLLKINICSLKVSNNYANLLATFSVGELLQSSEEHTATPAFAFPTL